MGTILSAVSDIQESPPISFTFVVSSGAYQIETNCGYELLASFAALRAAVTGSVAFAHEPYHPAVEAI